MGIANERIDRLCFGAAFGTNCAFPAESLHSVEIFIGAHTVRNNNGHECAGCESLMIWKDHIHRSPFRPDEMKRFVHIGQMEQVLRNRSPE